MKRLRDRRLPTVTRVDGLSCPNELSFGRIVVNCTVSTPVRSKTLPTRDEIGLKRNCAAADCTSVVYACCCEVNEASWVRLTSGTPPKINVMMSTVFSQGSDWNVGVRLVRVPVRWTLTLNVWPCARARVSAVMSKKGSNLFGLAN